MKIIGIVGKTASGKDTISKYIKEKYNIPPVISYTTRDMRESETDGVEHYFISKEQMMHLVKNEEVIAYTKFPKTGVEYCATMPSVPCCTYIIDPPGLIDLHRRFPDIDLLTIYTNLPEDEIIRRALGRGDKIEAVIKRLDSERDIMESFFVSGNYDACIDSTKSLDDVQIAVDMILKEHEFI